MKQALLTLLACTIPLLAHAQANGEEDPFKRDPFFTKPIQEFFQPDRDRPEEQAEREEDDPEPIRHYVRSMNEDGIDFQGGFESGPYNSNPLFSQFPNLPMIHYNRVNGLMLGVKKERMQWYHYQSFLNIPTIRPHGFIGYGTASREWEYAIGAEKLLGRNKYLMIGGEYHRATATDDYWRVGLIESGFTAFFGSWDFPDYYRMEGFGAYLVVRSRRLFEGALSYNFDEFSTLSQRSDFSLFGGGRHFSPNRPIHDTVDETDIRRVNLALSFNPRKLILLPGFTFSGHVQAELAGNSSYGNEFAYNRYLSQAIVYYNFEPGSMLAWRVRSGSITGEAPMFRQFQLGGIGSLRATPYKALDGNQMVLSNFEVHFGKEARNRGPWVDMNQFHFILFLDSGWTQMNERLADSSNPFTGMDRFRLGDMVHDAGIGAGSGLFRFELAWPLNADHRSPSFWVRFNPTF